MKKTDRHNTQHEKETLRSNIHNYIMQCIMDGTYKAGDRIVETRLAKELNVSQAPVREAILEMSMMGLLEVKPYSGTFVRSISADELEDIFHCRALIEEISIREAVRKITPHQLRRIELILDEMECCGSIVELTDLDKQFHDAILDAAGSGAMKRLWLSLHITEWTYVSASFSELSIEEIVRQHRIIFDYMTSGDEHAAGAYMYLHIMNFGKELVKNYIEKNRSSDH